MRTEENGSVLAELMAMQRDDLTEAKRRFNDLTPDELHGLSLELGARMCVDLLKDVYEPGEVVESQAA